MNDLPVGLVDPMACLQLVREVERRGLDVAPSLRRAGLVVDDLSDTAVGVPGDAALRLVRGLCAAAGDPDLGLAAGAAIRIADLGLAGLLLRSSEDVGAAIAQFQRWAQGSGPQSVVQVSFGHDGLLVAFRAPLGEATPRVLHDVALASIYTFSSQVVGDYRPRLVELAYPEPPGTARHVELFGCRLVFGAGVSRVTIPAEVLTRPLPNADPVAAATIAAHVKPLPPVEPVADFVTRVRTLLVTRDHGTPMPAVDDVAARLGMSPRTLRNRLHALGTSFTDLVEDAKRETALAEVLHTPHLPGAEIAARLGYAEPPAFYRAFKRWTSRTLTEYRDELAQGRSEAV